MDSQSKRRLIDQLKREHSFALNESTFRLCEIAAMDIKAGLAHRKIDPVGKKNSASLIHKMLFQSNLISNAAKTIKNETGSTQASLPLFIAIIVIFAVICYLYNAHHTDFFGVETMWKDLQRLNSID